MRGPAAFQIALRKFSIWRAAVVVIVFGVMAVITAWATHPGRVQNLTGTLVVIAIGAAALWLASRLWWVLPVTLGWDGEGWHLAPTDSPADEPETGWLEVHLDLGAWMLLRFVPEPRSHRARSRWLPAQRDECAHEWHALRSALYSTRSAPSGPSTQDGRPAP
jgi:hypothetical protein